MGLKLYFSVSYLIFLFGPSTGFFIDFRLFDSAIQQLTSGFTFSSRSYKRSSGTEAGAGSALPLIGQENATTVTLPIIEDTFKRDQVKCYGEIGCIEITDSWFDLLHRPLNLLPFDRAKINTRFILYTKERVADPIEIILNKTTLLESGYKPGKPVKFVVHGFIDTGFSSWVVKLCQQLSVIGDYNVFAVDWGGGSLPLYTQATANTRVVGLEIAHFIRFLEKEFNAVPSDMHIIGHSLGAHVAGYAGEKVEGLGRITGLDPAEPYFQFMPEFVRLDPSDAKFVDVIHSDGRTILLLGYGMQQRCGHMDFYPNDGKEQPGCELTEIPLNLVQLRGYDEVQREIFACNHHRAIYYFIESLLGKCQYVGHLCNDYDSYLKGQCYSCGEDGSRCALMGIDADKYPIGNRTLVPFYLSTGKITPFCVHHYRVNIQTAFPQHAEPWVVGKLKMSISGTGSSIKNINLSPVENLRIGHGTNLTFLIQNSKDLGSIEKVQIDWKYNNGYLDVMAHCWTYFCNNKLFIKKIEVVAIDEPGYYLYSNGVGKSEDTNSPLKINNKFSLCSEEGTKYLRISSGGSGTFERQC